MKHRALIVSFIAAALLCSVSGIAGAEGERQYIKPTFTPNTNGPTIGTTVKSAIEVNGEILPRFKRQRRT